MTMYATIDTLENRALGKPHMHHMLKTLSRLHESPARSVPASRLWRSLVGSVDAHGQDDYIAAAHNAGFISVDQEGNTERKNVMLTEKGRAVIGVEKPLWMAA